MCKIYFVKELIIINRLKELRELQKLNMREVAKELNIPYTTYVNYEKGMREPNSEMLILMANFFGVSLDYLIGRESTDKTKFPPPNITEDYTTFPVIGEVAAGYDHIACEDWEGDTVDIPNEYLKGRSRDEFFVLRVKGDSMYPDYKDGDKVLILKQTTLNYSGQVGVILYDGEFASLKRVEYKKGEDWLRMVPVNPMHPTKRIEGAELENCRILGIPHLLIRSITD